jgi:hypothetical protein
MQIIRGSFDVVTTTEALGWAHVSERGEPALVQAVLNQEVIGEALADIHRPDLAAAGLGDGNAGYAIKFYRPIDEAYLPFIVVKADGGDAELPRAPSLGFKEFFAATFAAAPHAGRPRSFAGALWTDRTDAGALLQGKLRAGMVADSAVPAIERLIQDGIALLPLGGAPDRQAWRAGLTAQAGAFVDEAGNLALLRAVLEDNPMLVMAEWVEYDEPQFVQPSTRNPSPAPAEALELIITFSAGVSLDVVRESHRLPEFTPSGRSRWVAPVAEAAAAGAGNLLDRYPLSSGFAALLGAGTIHRLRVVPGALALRLLVLPVRGRTLEIDASGTGQNETRADGALVLV